MVLNPDFQNALASIIRPIYARDLPDNLHSMLGWLGKLGLSKPAYPIITVAGSVGKGSTALALARYFSQAGARVGLYTSPHLHSFRERFQIDGDMISQEAFTLHVHKVSVLTQADPLQPSTFEAATLIAFDWFAAEQVDLAICEIGMGGRFDAVNAIPNQLTVFTPVELEHAAALGGTLETIAWHKAGILQPAGIGISLPQSPIVQAVFEREAASLNARILQVGNTAELLEQAHHLLGRYVPSTKPVNSTLWRDPLPGRLETVFSGEQVYIVDGAHTPLGTMRLRAHLDTLEPQPVLMIMALLRDKPAAELLRPFDNEQFHIVLAQLPGHRAAKPDEVLAQWKPRSAKIEIIEDIEAAIEAARQSLERVVAICGSLRTAAIARESLGLLTEDELAESRFTRALFENDAYLRKIR